MTTRTIRIVSVGAVVLLALVLAGLALSRRDSGAVLGKTDQQADATPPASEQIKQNDGGEKQVAPNLDTQEFKLTASNVSCSTSSINGVESRSCNGNIQVVPRAQADMDPGIYRLNEQTKLVHAGTEENLTNLQQLSQTNAFVKLSLVPGSDDLLAQISY